MWIDLSGCKPGPDDSLGKILEIGLSFPHLQRKQFPDDPDHWTGWELHVQERWEVGPAGQTPSRDTIVAGLVDLAQAASYAATMLVQEAEGLERRAEELEDEIEGQESDIEELEASLDEAEPDETACWKSGRRRGTGDYRCDECRGRDDCTLTCPCVTEALEAERAAGRASLAREQEKLAGLRKELEDLNVRLEFAERESVETAESMNLSVLIGPAVTPSVTRPRPIPATPAVTPARPCACGCGQPITSPRPEARYATGACRVRAHRARS
jgi:hypothetical protein